jgi:tetratricopeptide (TPR) repeat protein
MFKLYIKRIALIPFILLISTSFSHSQNLVLPRVSPAAEITQTIGLSEIIINYSRPSVRDRDIWGGLVPYNGGVPFPWRAGANENTTVYFSDDVKINDSDLAAGIYGFYIIPSDKEWILIFNKHSKSWGSFFYDSSQDALRINIVPERIHFNEWLEYRFENINSNSADICLHWENLNVRFTVEFNETEVVLNSLREQLLSLPGFGWQGPMQAAQYCLENEINYDEALKWIDQSIARNSNFSNNIVKAELLRKMEVVEESDKLRKIAFENASENELNTYGYQLINNNKIQEAIDVFKINVGRYSDSWNAYDSYAEALNLAGDSDGAIKNYELAKSKAPDEQKERIQQILSSIQSP